MIRVALGLALLVSTALAGCSSNSDTDPRYDAPKALDKMTDQEWCVYYENYLTNPQLTEQNRQLDLQRMKARGCPAP